MLGCIGKQVITGHMCHVTAARVLTVDTEILHNDNSIFDSDTERTTC